MTCYPDSQRVRKETGEAESQSAEEARQAEPSEECHVALVSSTGRSSSHNKEL